MTKIRNITTDNLGYKGQAFKAGKAVEVPTAQAKAMAEAMPDRFRLVKRAKNRKVTEEATENRAVE